MYNYAGKNPFLQYLQNRTQKQSYFFTIAFFARVFFTFYQNLYAANLQNAIGEIQSCLSIHISFNLCSLQIILEQKRTEIREGINIIITAYITTDNLYAKFNIRIFFAVNQLSQ